MLYYQIQPHSLNQHLWQIDCHFTQQNDMDFSLSLPNWVPGSYMIRDFAQHIISLHSQCNGINIPSEQISKNSWLFPGQSGEWHITYLVYAFDTSVRGSFLNHDRGFFDGACVFLRHDQRQNESCQLQITGLPAQWEVATTLPKNRQNQQYEAHNYRSLIDYPVTVGKLLRLPFQVKGINHEIVIIGHYPDFDQQQLITDVQKICATEIDFFQASAPFDCYQFHLFVGQKVYGGLEHSSSSALMADRHDLPQVNKYNTENYITLLGLFSHEYFHAWNVKSFKPAVFANSDLNQEAYTRLLWAFEGITSYYDDYFLVQSGVITTEQYLHLLAKTITRVQQGQGRLLQTLADSSFTAWTKYYKQNENSPNAIVSYYQKGALAALCLDQYIRQHSENKYTLADVMRALYRQWCENHQPLAETEWLKIAEQTTGLDLKAVYKQYIETANDLPLQETLAQFGIQLDWHALSYSHGGAYSAKSLVNYTSTPDLGARFKTITLGIELTQIFNNGSAEQAYLCAGDQLIAFNNEIITDFAKQWASMTVGQTLQVHYIRDGLLRQTTLIIQPALANTAVLSIQNHTLLQSWLCVQSNT